MKTVQLLLPLFLILGVGEMGHAAETSPKNTSEFKVIRIPQASKQHGYTFSRKVSYDEEKQILSGSIRFVVYDGLKEVANHVGEIKNLKAGNSQLVVWLKKADGNFDVKQFDNLPLNAPDIAALLQKKDPAIDLTKIAAMVQIDLTDMADLEKEPQEFLLLNVTCCDISMRLKPNHRLLLPRAVNDQTEELSIDIRKNPPSAKK